MIEFIAKSGICLFIFLAGYYLLLEKEKMHLFNRLYLLGSIVAALLIPVLELPPLPYASQTIITPERLNVSEPLAWMSSPVLTQQETALTLSHMIWIAYFTITGLLIFRFIRNLIKLTTQILISDKQKNSHATIVLLEDRISPHSFLNYIFLSKEDYKEQRIDDRILRHEASHIRQFHTLDLLFIETLKLFFWFNPVFSLYKRAIQLNHEFLADQHVTSHLSDITSYQQLIIENGGLKQVSLASNFNFSITKKRLKMMTKRTSTSKKIVLGLFSTGLILGLGLVFSKESLAIQNPGKQDIAQASRQEPQRIRKAYYGGSTIRFIDEKGNNMRPQKRFEELTTEEQQRLPLPQSPSQSLINQWKDSKKYLVTVNFGEELSSLSQLKPSQFISYSTYKIPNSERILVTLIEPGFLEKNKKLGGGFNWLGDQVFVAPPPPVVVPAK